MNLIFQLAAIMLTLLLAGPALGAEALAPASPREVQLSPKNGLVFVQQTLPVHRDAAGQAYGEFVLPGGARDLHFAAGAPVWRTESTTIELANQGRMAQLASTLEKRIGEVEGRLAAIKTSMTLWENEPSTVTYQDLSQQIQNAQQILPGLVQEQAALTKELKNLKARLEAVEQPAPLGQKITVWLDGSTAAQNVTLDYSYVLEACGWQPLYFFEAQPGATRNEDGINVQLFADVWQFAGMDWDKAHIALVTQSATGAREPARLPRWVVEAREERTRERAVAEGRAMMLAEEAPMPVAARPAPKAANVTLNEKALYARFDLNAAGLREGRSRVRILGDTWKAPLTWLARPVRGNTGVWLMADCTLPEGKIWPEGKATYYVEGQDVGEGMFRPEGSDVKLFFGADPRVSLVVGNDTKRRGESGFIGKEKHWNWSWTYTLTNRHPKPVNVRIERPLPQIVNDKVTVKHENSPEAVQDTQKHLLYWDVAVPANGQASVRHGLAISAPADMPISPVAP